MNKNATAKQKAEAAPAQAGDTTTKWYQDNVLVKSAHTEVTPAKLHEHTPLFGGAK